MNNINLQDAYMAVEQLKSKAGYVHAALEYWENGIVGGDPGPLELSASIPDEDAMRGKIVDAVAYIDSILSRSAELIRRQGIYIKEGMK